MHLRINVEAKFGSDFQKEVAMNSLKMMMIAWKEFYKTTHRNNVIGEFEIGEQNEQ